MGAPRPASASGRQADGHRFVWWPSLLAGNRGTGADRLIFEEGRRPSRHDEVDDDTWGKALSVTTLPGARRVAGTFPGASGPNCFGAVMAATGARGADSVWMLREPFEEWLVVEHPARVVVTMTPGPCSCGGLPTAWSSMPR